MVMADQLKKQVFTFHGIQLDTVAQTSDLLEAKLLDLRARVARFINYCKVTLCELQELVGHLNFACPIIAPDRAFLRVLCDMMRGLQRLHHHIWVRGPIRLDLEVWNLFLCSYNGVSFWREDLRLEAELQVHSDASGSLGFGIYFHRHCVLVNGQKSGETRGFVLI